MSRPTHPFSREAVRQVDAAAVERYRIPGIVLMENAARQVADVAVPMLREPASARALVLCGGGNNGGDGLAAARHLHNRGVDVTVVLLKDRRRYTGDARTNLEICQAMSLRLSDAAGEPLEALKNLDPHDVIIDALLGTGLSTDVHARLARVIRWVNGQPSPVLAVDIPSGLDCDTGKPLGAAVRATRTITFVGIKKGFAQPGARDYTGQVTVADIGAPIELVDELADRDRA
ncbi:MAG: NAD(P)H-hydrate epimerase [Alphaproteobacteria bacterium]|jgi:NAD(P)H-hydrate epimerase|nr:NAD(P)H-hydrate epimerase [Alphaproteobacteria bacterium]